MWKVQCQCDKGNTNVATTASPIPNPARILPLRAESGELNNLRPQTKARQPIRKLKFINDWKTIVSIFFRS